MENVYERIHRVLTWKRIIAFNVVLFLVLVVPISVRLAQEDTENRSSAAQDVPLASVEPPAAYPAEAPRIDRVSEFFGKAGDTVVILGANFGEYRWGSRVYVGNVEASPEAIIRWSNTILEVQIPDAARTGKVWVMVNGRQAVWEGSLLLTDVARAAQVGLRKDSSGQAVLWVANASGVSRGLIQIGHVSEPVSVEGMAATITEQSAGADSLGKKLTLSLELQSPLTSAAQDVIRINHPGIGIVQILRVELYDTAGQLVNVFADPFNVKIQ